MLPHRAGYETSYYRMTLTLLNTSLPFVVRFKRKADVTMLRTLLIVLIAVLIAGYIVDARFLEDPYFLGSRVYADEPLQLVSAMLPKRAIRQVIENQPLPCRFKLCVTYY
ncbi:hypothetical protein DICVIV_05523 [Dictyocaulus viviparus]|uniref:Uncharacterized protein n=1 Tax=Dictyocaulus viviparus TaxID=29172 RepID=A0A0D8XUX7_DICVI|nr:hypothetical protein DICVIV_05523 [Dictyocaulus viviparus]